MVVGVLVWGLGVVGLVVVGGEVCIVQCVVFFYFVVGYVQFWVDGDGGYVQMCECEMVCVVEEVGFQIWIW